MSKKVQYILGVVSILILGIVGGSLRMKQKAFSLQSTKNQLQTSPGFTTQTLELKTQPTVGNLIQNNNNLAHYDNEALGVSFDYQNNGVISDRSDKAENLQQIEVYYAQQSRIFITHEVYPKPVDPKEWFATNRNKFNDLVVENEITLVQGEPALFLGIPNTCKSVPVVVVIISKDNEIFTFTYVEAASRIFAVELEPILESLTFKEKTFTHQSISRELLEFPKPPVNISCS